MQRGRITEKEKEENISRVKEKLRGGDEKNREGKRGKYLQKEKEGNIWRRKRRKIFAERNFRGKDTRKKEKEENIWRRQIFLRRRRKRREIFGEGRYFFAEEKKNGKGKRGKYHGERKMLQTAGANWRLYDMRLSRT